MAVTVVDWKMIIDYRNETHGEKATQAKDFEAASRTTHLGITKTLGRTVLAAVAGGAFWTVARVQGIVADAAVHTLRQTV